MEELQMELEQLYMINATIYQPLYEITQVGKSFLMQRSSLTLY